VAHLGEADSLSLEDRGDLGPFLDREPLPLVQVVAASELDHHRKFVVDLPSDRAGDLDGEPHPVLEAPPPSVPPPVGAGAQELGDQITVSAVDLYSVEARFLNPASRPTELSDDRFDVLARHLSALAAGIRRLVWKRDDQLAAASLERRFRIHPAVCDLHDDVAIQIVNGVGHSPISGDLAVVIDAVHVGEDLSASRHEGISRDDQPDAVARQGLHQIDAGIADVSISIG
jgi:hypothetical protein